MPKLDRKDIKIFGGENASNEIVQFGSTRAGSANPSTDPDTLQGLTNYGQGWSEGVIASSGIPPFTEFNTLQYLVSRELAYLQQAGFPEYSATTTYYIGKSIVREPEGTKLYISLTDDNIGNPLTDPVNWQLLTDLSGDTLINLNVLNKVNFAPQPVVEIVSGSVPYTGQNMVIDTEGSASSDTLVTITGGVAGDEVEIRSNASGRDIIIQSGQGANELNLPNNVDITLRESIDRLTFVKRTAGYWTLKSRSLDVDPYISADIFNIPISDTKTISSGAITFSNSFTLLDTEGAASTDDLDTITGGSTGDFLLLRTTISSREVVIKSGAGTLDKIVLRDGLDVTLADSADFILLHRRSDTGYWVEVCRSIKSDFAFNKVTAASHSYLPNGYIIQRGVYTGGAHGPTITLDEAFTSGSSYSVACNTTQGASRYVSVNTKGATSFVATQYTETGATSTNNFDWIAIGY